MIGVDREELLAVIGAHGAATPGLAPRDALDEPGAPRVELVNPTCGDRVDLALTVSDGRTVLRGEASGCTLSRAAASLLAATVHPMAPEEAAALLETLVSVRASGRPLDRSLLPELGGVGADGTAAGSAETAGSDPWAESLLALAELTVAPLRRRCILLPWTAARTLLEARR